LVFITLIPKIDAAAIQNSVFSQSIVGHISTVTI